MTAEATKTSFAELWVGRPSGTGRWPVEIRRISSCLAVEPLKMMMFLFANCSVTRGSHLLKPARLLDRET